MAKILLVDDETSILGPLKQFLIKIEHDVVGTATSAEEAISMARLHKPDLLLMDIHLPGEMDGIEAADTIKKELKIPSIFMTGYIRRDYIDRAARVEPFGYILKPFKMSEVQAAIEIALYQ